MIFDLVKDFSDVLDAMPQEHPRHRILKLLDEAIRRDLHFIDRHPTTFFQCMWNTCWWYDCPAAARHYIEPKRTWRISPLWSQVNTMLFWCLEKSSWWNDFLKAARHYVTPNRVWRKSRLPSQPQKMLHEYLEQWRDEKERHTPGFIWVHSIRPPQSQLRLGQRVFRLGNAGQLRTATISPDGRRIAAAWQDKMLYVWDTLTGEIIRLLSLSRSAFTLAASTSGRRIVCGMGNWIRVYDVDTGQEVLCMPGGEYNPFSPPVALSEDGRLIVSGCPSDTTIQVWDAMSGTQLLCLCGHQRHVLGVAITSDGCRVVSGSMDRTVRIWDVGSATELRCLHGHAQGVTAVAVTGDGRRAASGSQDKTVRLWDAVSGNELKCFRGHEDKVSSIAFSLDGNWIISGSDDKTVRIWDGESGEEFHCLKNHEAPICNVACSSDGRWLLSASIDGTVCVWDLEAGVTVRSLRGHEHWIFSVSASGDGRRIVSGSLDGTVRIWDASTGEEILCLKGDCGEVYKVGVSWDAARVVSFHKDQHVIQVWNTQTGDLLSRFEVKAGADPERMAVSPDGRRIVATVNAQVLELSAEAGEELHRYACDSRVRSVTFSHDGRQIISTTEKETRVWDTASGETLAVSQSNDAQGRKGLLFEAKDKGYETQIEMRDGNVVAWFPEPLSLPEMHPSGCAWAGCRMITSHLYIVQLVGDLPRYTSIHSLPSDLESHSPGFENAL